MRPTVLLFFSLLSALPAPSPQTSAPRAYLGFDRNDYPGDAAMPILITSDFTRRQTEPAELAYWVYNDACAPSPGCVVPRNPPPPSKSGIPYVQIWQFVRSPAIGKPQFTVRAAQETATATHPATPRTPGFWI